MSHAEAGQRHDAVAIVGIGCRFPGGVSDPESFWRLLSTGKQGITEIPRDRIDLNYYFDAVPQTPGRMMTRWGGYLDRIEEFDADFFGVSPREAERMDPQQRLLLETAWEALEDAGQDLKRVDHKTASVFVGQWTSDFESRLFSDPESVDFYMTTGSGRYSASGRLSYLLGFRGPSLTVDTACSSSLAAIHLAVRSIREGESSLAVAGGVNVILQPHISIAYSQSGMMAPDGKCKFGDASGDGYVRSEGAGLLVLKPLDSALAAGDRVYAVIRGTAINNDGRGSGSMGTPSRSGQEELLRAAYRDAGVDPGLVGYIEAHGTGTRAGDPVELGALGSVLGETRAPGFRALVGSVKTNIGHTESAAGAAGLIKAALSLHRGAIPPSLNYSEPNPNIPWSDLPCEVVRELTPWGQPAELSFAGISAFGIAGTNSHVVLQGAPVEPLSDRLIAGGNAYLLPLSARGREALRALASRYADLLIASDAPALQDVCWSAATRRTELEHRAAFVAQDTASMADALRRFASGDAAATADGIVHSDEPPRVAFVVPGQGAQWIGMARELIAREPVFKDALERCQQAAKPFVDWSILDQLAAEPGSDMFRLDQIDVIQPVLVAIAIAYAKLLDSLGVRPDAVVGHSMGEVGAAYIAGVLDLGQAMQVICRRSALLRRVSGQGAMALVELPMAEVRERLTEVADFVSLAASNSPRSSVISGQPEAVRRVMAELEADGIFCRLVKVDVASHSPQMAPLATELTGDLATIEPGACQIPIYSTALGRCPEGHEFGAEYWATNLRQPVLFSTATRSLSDDGVSIFVELGPHPVLLPSIQQTVPTAITLACGRKDEAQETTLLTALAGLWAAGYPIDWRRAIPGGGRNVSLPLYPWQRERHWVEAAELRPGPSVSGRRQLRPGDEERGWLHRLQWVPADALSTIAESLAPDRPWLIFTGDAVMGSELVNAFAMVGVLAEAAPLDDLEAVLTEHANGGVPPSGIAVLAGDDADAAFLPLRAVQARLRADWSREPQLWFVTFGGQTVASASHRVSVNQAALWGAGRIVAEEHPNLWGGLVDLDPDATDFANAVALVREIMAASGQVQVVVRPEGRYIPRLVPAGRNLVFDEVTWRQDAAYLITGGLGGVGMHIAGAMASSGARRLILLGRTALPPRELWNTTPPDTEDGERVAAVRALEAMGVAVHTNAVDIGDEIDLRRFLEQYAAEGWPPIRGVVHAAATFDTRLAEAMDRRSFDAVVTPKLHGAQLLDQLLPGLDFFILFSSTGAFLPIPGGANYAAANAGLDALAQDRRARGLPALSIAWCPWENTGAVKGLSGRERTAALARRGVLALSPERCSSLFIALRGCAAATIAVFPADLGRLQQTHSARSLSLFRDLFAAQSETASEQVELSDQLANMSASKRRLILERLVKDAVARVLKIEPGRLDPRKPLGNMGLNSLMAMELRNRLEIALDRPLSATLAWNYPTIEILVDHLAGDAPQPSSRPVGLPHADGDLLQSLNALTALSDAEVMGMLLNQSADGKP